MPTYEYICPKCGYEFEQFQSMSAALLKKCPRCKKTGLKRLIGGGAGLIFKGTGFYITDYKKSASPKEGDKPKPAGGESKPSSEGKSPASAKPGSDAKPAPSAPKLDLS